MRGGGQLEKKLFKATPLYYVIQGNLALLWHSKNLLFLVYLFLLVPFIYAGDIL